MTIDQPDISGLLLITGGLGDIGIAIARKFSANGWRLALNDLVEQEEGEVRLAEVLPEAAAAGTARYYEADNSNPAAVNALFANVAVDEGVPDMVAVNAAVVEPMPFLELTPQAWRRHIDVNLTGAFFVAQCAAKAMIDSSRKGRIVFTSSWVQDFPSNNIAAYTVSKAGLKMLARQMALELARHGIRANLVAPGIVDAGLSGEMFRSGQAKREPFESLIPLHRLQSANDVADAFWLLAQPEASYLTGSTILCDGGMSLFNWQLL